jgi:C-terminal processing protease CtpA/Prc
MLQKLFYKEPKSMKTRLFCIGLLTLIVGGIRPVIAQSDTPRHRAESLAVLRSIKNNLREFYFDKSLRGIDVEAKIEAASKRIKTLTYNWEMYRVLAQFLLDFDDSHTAFALPPRADHFTYGFDVQMIGNECLVTSVASGSDAEKKGLQTGDRIDNIGKFVPNRNDLWKIMYVLYKLSPNKEIGLKISKPDGTTRVLLIEAATRSKKEFSEETKRRKAAGEFKPVVCHPVSQAVVACKLRTFSVDQGVILKMMKEAAKYKKLILDLRGNPGGYVSTELFMVGAFFERDVKVADEVTRKKTEARVAKGWRADAFTGELAIMLDSDSASAAEVFARVIQLEKRGKVFGDVSSGSVMTSIFVPISSNSDQFTTVIGGQFGMSVTVADVLMPDGSRLEKRGVIPDVPVIPTQDSLAQGLDPVLALTATAMGSPLTPEAAGKFHFIRERSQSKVEAESDDPK